LQIVAHFAVLINTMLTHYGLLRGKSGDFLLPCKSAYSPFTTCAVQARLENSGRTS
jgi:hypothetical protein